MADSRSYLETCLEWQKNLLRSQSRTLKTRIKIAICNFSEQRYSGRYSRFLLSGRRVSRSTAFYNHVRFIMRLLLFRSYRQFCGFVCNCNSVSNYCYSWFPAVQPERSQFGDMVKHWFHYTGIVGEIPSLYRQKQIQKLSSLMLHCDYGQFRHVYLVCAQMAQRYARAYSFLGPAFSDTEGT